MVTVELAGGLGNQMFEYACGRTVSLALNQDLQLNTWWVDRDPIRNYALACFPNIKVPLVKQSRGRVCQEQASHFQPLLHGGIQGEDVTLRGFWQSEKYFAAIANVIRKDFEFPYETRPESGATCAIHVRRGDYISDPVSVAIMGNLQLAYYFEAICRLEDLLNSTPRYFLFSDDPTWCKKYFIMAGPEAVVEGNKDFEDLRLMSLCRHHIVANSSFSWWGAWLSVGQGITFTPRKWFAMRESKDVCPDSWLRI